MAQNKFITLIETILAMLALIAGVEYFKYATMTNYEWFHCTVQRSLDPSSSIVEYTSVGGESCDKRGQFKSIVKAASREFDPNYDDVVFCIKEDLKNERIVGYGANVKDAELVKSSCDNVIYW
ncbi:hypothetical protein WICPIJ_009707 [Wickerhamomyces pijperi]|uniref:Ceramide synthase subunit LIP1 n=1 Tax=Wickerhamomyces pijperi TaxID=599730 RepID=A0A9P8PL84_WICPI|nr:hypothetical protein WICPIJ_009707 [Wickerhamomyces pijperi]